MATLFSDGFESGDVSAWSDSSLDEGDVSVSAGAKLHGDYGLSVLINDTNEKKVLDSTPDSETRYRFRFYLDPNSLTMAGDDEFSIVILYNAAWGAVFNLKLAYKSGAYAIVGNDATDGAWNKSTNYITITDAPHCIEVDWKASSAPLANDGWYTVWIDGTQMAVVTGIDNDASNIGAISLGAVEELDAGTSGTFYIDDFSSNDDGNIIGELSLTLLDHFQGLGMVMAMGWVDVATADSYIDTLLSKNIKYLRMVEGWDIEDRSDLNRAAAISATTKGADVLFGVAYTAPITAANWSAYRAECLEAAAWAQTNGMYEFCIGNEEESKVDGTTMTAAQMIVELKSLATDVQAVYTRGNVTYATYAAYVASWVAAGKGDIDIVSANLYMGDTSFYQVWEIDAKLLIDTFGAGGTYLSEFAPSSTTLDSYTTNEGTQATAVLNMLKYIESIGITRAYFYMYNGDDFGALKSDGVTYRQLWDVLSNAVLLDERKVSGTRSAAGTRVTSGTRSAAGTRSSV